MAMYPELSGEFQAMQVPLESLPQSDIEGQVRWKRRLYEGDVLTR
jgi:hypothetical protein